MATVRIIQSGKDSLRGLIQGQRRLTSTSHISSNAAESRLVNPFYTEINISPPLLLGFDLPPLRFEPTSLFDRQYQSEPLFSYRNFPDLARLEARGGPIKIDDDVDDEEDIDSFDDDDDEPDECDDIEDIDDEDDDDESGSDSVRGAKRRA